MNFKMFDIQWFVLFVPVTVMKLILHMYLTPCLSFSTLNYKFTIENNKK